MIKTIGLNKWYGDLHVLKDIELTINDSEIVSIVGASGAGKTTLLQILGTLDKADSGELMYDSVSPFGLKEAKLAKFRNDNIGFVFQFHQLLPEFTACENVCIPALIKGEKLDNVKSRAMDLLKVMGLKDRAEHKPAELSGGEQQRVAVARALMNKPKVILADEPSGNLDSKNKEELHKLFFEIRDTFGITFIIVTHDNHLAYLSDRIIELKDGSIVNRVDVKSV